MHLKRPASSQEIEEQQNMEKEAQARGSRGGSAGSSPDQRRLPAVRPQASTPSHLQPSGPGHKKPPQARPLQRTHQPTQTIRSQAYHPARPQRHRPPKVRHRHHLLRHKLHRLRSHSRHRSRVPPLQSRQLLDRSRAPQVSKRLPQKSTLTRQTTAHSQASSFSSSFYSSLVELPSDSGSCYAPPRQTRQRQSQRSAPTSASATPSEPAGPIAKAKATLGEVNTEALDDVLSGTNTVETPPPAAAAPRASAPEPTPATSGAPRVDKQIVGTISDYLSSVTIGGVRTGDRPKVILNGTSYQKGDLIDPTTGLRFSGMREGKLAFTDRNGVVYLKSF